MDASQEPSSVVGVDPPLFHFQAASILSDAFSLYFSSFVPFTLLVGTILLPSFLVQQWAERAGSVEAPALGLLLLSGLLQILLMNLSTAAMVYGVFQALRGRPVSTAECLQAGLGRMLPVIGVGFVVGLLTVIGLVLLCVPGLFAYTVFYVALPVAVVEQLGVEGSLRRSVQLTADFRWSVFAIAFGLAVVAMLFGGLIGATAALALPPLVAALAGFAIQVVGHSLSAVTSSLVYYRLRQIKESVTDVEAIASVFD